jgi:hypothetical protein
MSNLGIIFAGIALALSIAIVLYDWMHDLSRAWLDEHHCQWRVPPWWVRLDRWIYHCTFCRVQNVAHEQHVWFGGRLVSNIDDASIFNNVVSASVNFLASDRKRREASYWHMTEPNPVPHEAPTIAPESRALGRFMQTCVIREVRVSVALAFEVPVPN